MIELITRVRASYRVILVDSPPLGSGVDPFTLGTLTGSLLLVLRTGTTNLELARIKLALLDHLPIRLLGVVLNDVLPGGRLTNETPLVATTRPPASATNTTNTSRGRVSAK